MKRYTWMFVSCRALGLLMLILETVVDPMTLNNITGILSDFRSHSGVALVVLLGVFMLSSLLTIGARMCDEILRQRISANMCTDWSLRLMRKVLFTRNSFLLKNDPEKIAVRIARDTSSLAEHRMTVLLEMPMLIMGLLVSLYMMFFGSLPWLGRLGLAQQQGNVLLGLIIVCMSPLHVSFLLYNKKVMEIEQQQADAYEQEYQQSNEALRGIMDIRASNAFSFILKRLLAVFTNTRDNRLRLCSIFAVFQNVSGLAWALTQVVVLAVSAWLISRKDVDFAFKDYMGFSVLCGMFMQYVTRGVNVVISWQRAKPAEKRIEELDRLPDEFSDDVGQTLSACPSRYDFNGVDYSIDNAVKVLDQVNVTISRGEHIALVGPSGCGKSTLLKMAMRHLSPTSGEIHFGEQDIADIRFPDYAHYVAYVSQKPFVFSGTLYDNIFVGRELALSDEGLLDILDAVALSDDLLRKSLDLPAVAVCPECKDSDMSLRDFLQGDASERMLSDHELGENLERAGLRNRAILSALQFRTTADGQGLSGGQMAKVALARALAGSPEILLLDEVTAPLDELSQEKVTRMLATRLKGRTIISISHRIPAVRGMDRILVMDAGRIVQDGTYEELVHRPGLFAHLVARETGILPEAAADSELVLSSDERGMTQALSLSPVFKGISSVHASRFAKASELVRVQAGDFVFHKGESGASMYVLMSGVVQIGGSRFHAGCTFGEIALFGGIPRTMDVLAVEESELICLDKEVVVEVGKAHPDVLLEILRNVSRIAAREAARR